MAPRNSLLLALVGSLCLCLSACSRYWSATTLRGGNLRAYEGAQLPPDQVAFLSCAAENLEIAEIDAVPIAELRRRTNHYRNYSYVELLPGEHTILVKGTSFDTTHRGFHPNLTVDIASYSISTGGESDLAVLLEPGHVYVIKSRISKSQPREDPDPAVYLFTIFIQDVQTQRIVARVETEIRK